MANPSSVAKDNDFASSPLFKAMFHELMAAKVRPAETAKRLGTGQNFVVAVDQYVQQEPEPLNKSFQNLWPKASVERLAFEQDPGQTNQYAQLYKMKMRLVPDVILKRILNTDDLVAAIVMTRQGQLSWFGRPREERHDNGFVIEPKKGVLDRCSEEQQKVLQDRIEKATELLKTCGHTEGWKPHQQMDLTDFLKIQVRYALGVGRIATEAVYADGLDGEKRFHSFRPIDAGTIYRAAPQKQAAEQVREAARAMLERIKNKRLQPEKYLQDEYAWVQVVDGKPVQAFSTKECLVKNFYPCADIELDGYPVTPIDTMLSAVMTHINIVTHNKLYFQHGRASRGMLVIKSHDVNDDVVNRIRQQFNASINSVNNAWRMPVFGITPEDELTWQPIDQGQRDAEFQYLTDMNARVILSAFQMSPEELPGWTYLSRGTNNQALCLNICSGIWTEAGFKTIGQILENSDEERVRVWTGAAWVDARVFKTGPKQNIVTTLWNGSRLQTSPDHRFRAIGPEGTPVWKRQRDLVVGDSVLVNRRPIEGVGEVPSYGDRKLTEDMMEVLGWLTGDGNISVRFQKNTGNLKQGVLSWFYHQEKERDVWERHSRILTEFGLGHHKHQDRQVSEAEAADLKERYGFKSVASNRLRNTLYDTDFWRWLGSLGFQSSADGKVVPAFVHALPIGHRQAFLRGLFSADGTCNRAGADAVRIVIHDDRLRQQTRDLLLSLGIRTRFHEGLFKQDMDGPVRKMVPGASMLAIKDKISFYKQIGFLQAHKQPRPEILADSDARWERVPASTAASLLHGLGSVPNVPRAWKDGCAVSFLRRILQEAGRPFPAWLDDYHLEEVVSIEVTDEVVDMADVEVFDDTHAFICNGAVVHNSESNNEYRLEAHRDLGIRPLVKQFEDFFNQHVLPLLDANLAKLCRVRFLGLDADTEEKEAVRIQQDAGLHMSQNDVMEKVEKDPIPRELCGDIILAPAYQMLLDKYVPVGVILEKLMGIPNASQDPQWAYVRDPNWFQWQQMRMAAQQQPAPGGGDGGGGSAPAAPPDDAGVSADPTSAGSPEGSGASAGEGSGSADVSADPSQSAGGSAGDGEDLTRSLDQAIGLLSKSERHLPASKRKLLVQHRKVVDKLLEGLEKDALEATKEILKAAGFRPGK